MAKQSVDQEENEVLQLTRRLLENLWQTKSNDLYQTVFRFFLSQSVFVRRVFQRRLSREFWPNLFSLFEGEKPLRLGIGGSCPGACLLGFVVWLHEQEFFNCAIQCGGKNLKSDGVTEEVITATRNGGWNIELIDCFQDSFDLVIIGHPQEPTLPFERSLESSGCFVLFDFIASTSFLSPRLQYAEPPVIDLMGAGLNAFDEVDRSAITHFFPGRLPVLEEKTFAILFVGSDTVPFSGSVTENQIKHPEVSSLSSTDDNTSSLELRWKGKWVKGDCSGACPKEFLCSGLDLPLSSVSSSARRSQEYYKSLSQQGYDSRLFLEGMGRPMLRFHYQDY